MTIVALITAILTALAAAFKLIPSSNQDAISAAAQQKEKDDAAIDADIDSGSKP